MKAVANHRKVLFKIFLEFNDNIKQVLITLKLLVALDTLATRAARSVASESEIVLKKPHKRPVLLWIKDDYQLLNRDVDG